MSELNAEAVLASIVELRASIAEQGKRFDKVLDELRVNNHKVGELTNKVGRIIEKVVVPGIVDKFNEKGFYVLRQPDVMAVKIMDFPKGRSAKAW